MINLSITNLVIIQAFEKGYRTIDGKIFNPKNKELNPTLSTNGYPKITFIFNKKSKSLYAHKLTAYQKFGDKILQKGIQVRHLNGNKLDFSFSNIEIGTALENKRDIPVEKRKEIAYKSNFNRRKLSIEQAEEIRNEYLTTENKRGFFNRIGIKYSVHRVCIRNIIHNKIYLK
jgi:hypothetical protein